MGLTKAQIAERKAFVKQLVIDEHCSVEETMERYDAKFGTHYSANVKKASISVVDEEKGT